MRISTEVEKWRPVPGFELLYEVSNLGKVRSLERFSPYKGGTPRRRKAKMLTLGEHDNGAGHLRVNLHKDARQHRFYVHYLVLLAFVSDRPAGMVARHLNDDAKDNRLSNLAWGTPQENSLDAIRNGKSPNANKRECIRGHAFDEENTYWRKGRRTCRACARDYERRRRVQRKKLKGITHE